MIGHRGARILAASATLAGVIALSAVSAAKAPAGPTASIELRKIATVEQPTYAGQAPGRPQTLYVAEQQGRIIAIRRGRTLKRPFLDIRARVASGSAETSSEEAGLFSFAFDPDYARNGRFYVFYTGVDGNNHLEQYRRSARNPERATPGSGRRVLTVRHPYADSHNAGQLQFGPDGMLWLATGDGGCCGDIYDQARSLGSLLGKLLRIDPLPHRGGYLVPADNPLVGVPGSEPIYAWGLRNPWRFSFDRLTGALAIADVGDNEKAREEIDFLSPGAADGVNFGWPEFEGYRLRDPGRPGSGDPVFPIAAYAHHHGQCAITGGYVVRDPELPALYGRYLYADYCGGRIRSLAPPPLSEAGMPPPGRIADDRDEGVYLRFPTSWRGARRAHLRRLARRTGVPPREPSRLSAGASIDARYPGSQMAGRSRDRLAVAAAMAATTLAAAAALAGTAPGAGAQEAAPSLKQIGDFESPVYVADAPGSPKLLFVVEQPGTIQVLRKHHRLKRPFLDLGDHVQYGGEQGLLSVAFDPGYAKNRRFYVYYVDPNGDIRVDSLRRKRHNPTRADARSRRKLIVVPHPSNTNHNGGQLQFGPDGMLYLATGDGGAAGDPPGNAQNPEVLLGKLLRIEPRKHGYRSPDTNPFANAAGLDEIYSLGLRNPYRFSFDSASGDLWIGDVGQDDWEEVDHASTAAARGANFGWDLFEGNHEFEGDAQNPPAGYRGPVHEYPSSDSNCAVTGGFVSHDPAVPALANRYVYADFCVGALRSLDAGAADPSATDAPTGIQLSSPSGFGEGARGELYVTSLDGPVYRIVQR